MAGYAGADCGMQPFAQQTDDSSPIASWAQKVRSMATAFLDPFAGPKGVRGVATGRVHPKKDSEDEDFGVTHNKDGSMGIVQECPKSCSFRGMCEDGVCYCQPGFFGDTCEASNLSQGDTLELTQVAFFCLVTGCMAGGATFVFLTVRSLQKQSEVEVLDSGPQ
jgi:hypothetical protein